MRTAPRPLYRRLYATVQPKRTRLGLLFYSPGSALFFLITALSQCVVLCYFSFDDFLFDLFPASAAARASPFFASSSVFVSSSVFPLSTAFSDSSTFAFSSEAVSFSAASFGEFFLSEAVAFSAGFSVFSVFALLTAPVSAASFDFTDFFDRASEAPRMLHSRREQFCSPYQELCRYRKSESYTSGMAPPAGVCTGIHHPSCWKVSSHTETHSLPDMKWLSIPCSRSVPASESPGHRRSTRLRCRISLPDFFFVVFLLIAFSLFYMIIPPHILDSNYVDIAKGRCIVAERSRAVRGARRQVHIRGVRLRCSFHHQPATRSITRRDRGTGERGFVSVCEVNIPSDASVSVTEE